MKGVRSQKPKFVPAAPATATPPWKKFLAAVAVLGALASGCFFAYRPLMDGDLGYHLAYGDEFWSRGRVVDYNDFLYTLPAAGAAYKPAPGPGNWYDKQGRYRFPNSNWLFQVSLAGVNWLGGLRAVWTMRLLVVLGIYLLTLGTLRNLGVPWLWAGATLVLYGLAANERFEPRPEILSYLLLAGQLFVLTRRAGAGARPISWPAVAALITMQWLLVNVHSYYLLGLAMTAAVAIDQALRWWWWRNRSQAAAAEPGRMLRRLLILLAAQCVIGLANPWTWRLLALPFQTLLFLRENRVGEAGSQHPWGAIIEFVRPFAAITYVVKAYIVVLPLAGAGALAALWRRQWAWAMMIVGFTIASLSMRRNIPLAALLALPLSVAMLWPPVRKLVERLGTAGRAISRGAAVAASALSLAACAAVASQWYYVADRDEVRFWAGPDRLLAGLAPAEWIRGNKPQGRLWTDFNSSSNIYYFTGCQRAVPIVTNTWAYPPEVMGTVQDAVGDLRVFHDAVREYSPAICVLSFKGSFPLIQHLFLNEPVWAMVYVDWGTAIFLRTDGPSGYFARRERITEDNLDASALVRDIQARPASGDRLYQLGTALAEMELYCPAIAVLEQCLAGGFEKSTTLEALGICHLRRSERFPPGSASSAADRRAAERYFRQALAIDDNQNAREGLELLRRSSPP